MEKQKSKKRKLQKRILAWIVCFAMTFSVFAVMPGGTMEVQAASADGAKIAAAAQSYMGKEQSVGRCLGFCRLVYRDAGYDTAQDPNGCSSACAYHSWTVSSHLGSTSKDNIPLGALVFFSGASSQFVLSCGARPGHVGIYVGDGYIINARGTVKNGTNISKDKISLWESWGYAFLGWRPISGYTLDSGGSAVNNPIGALDYAEGRTNAVWIRGWAFDLDDISSNLEIHVYIGGPAGSGEGHKIVANAYRNDVNSVYGVGDYHGFDVEISTSLLGDQEVYVYAINIESGDNQLIGSKTVNISKPNDPQGCVDRIQGGKGFVNVNGWGFDLDDISKPIEIHVYIVDSEDRTEGYALVADAYRDDVNSVYGVGAYHGYDKDISTSLYGNVRVDVYAINIGGGNNVLIGSDTVTVDCNHLNEEYIANNNGTHSRKCNNCGETEVSNCSYDKLVTEPTCKKSGYTTYTCRNCGYSYETDFVDCIKHSFTNYISDNNAQIGVDGTKTAYCDYGCGTTDTVVDEGSALETEQPGKEESEKPNPETPEKLSTTYTYKLNDDKTTITITKCTSSDENIAIPSSIDGYIVTGIGDKAFQNVTSIKTISFPSTLKTIGNYAFAGCTSLITVTLPDSLTGLYTYVFKGCTSLKSAKLNVGRINVAEGLFQGCSSLSSVTLPNSVQYIRTNAFSGCTLLKTLSLPKSLSIVYANAFLNSGIKVIQYAGTNTDWKNVTIGTTGNTSFLNAAVTGSNGKTFSANKSKWNTSSPAPVKKPSVSKVKSFKATAGKKKLTLTWNKLSGVAGYQIQISTKKNFKGAKTISIFSSKKAYTKKSLKAKKKYYIRIRAYKTYKDANKKTQKVYGKWTTINKKTK